MSNPNELFEQYQGYARALAHTLGKRVGSKRVAREDLVQWGMAGLWEAAQRFNSEGNVSFETFAYYRVRGAIFDELRKLSMIPRSTRKKINASRGQDEFTQSEVPAFDPRVSDGEQAVAVRDSIRGLGAIFLASQLGGNDDEGGNPLENIADEERDEPVDRELIEKVAAAKSALSERQQLVLDGFYVQGKSMTELAQELGVNKATISREHSRAVTALRDAVGLPPPG